MLESYVSGRFRNRKHSCGDRGVQFRVDELTDYIHTLADTCRDPRLFGSISKRLAWKVPDWLEATAIETTVNLARRSDAETRLTRNRQPISALPLAVKQASKLKRGRGVKAKDWQSLFCEHQLSRTIENPS